MQAKARAFWGLAEAPEDWEKWPVLLDAKRPRGYTVAACPTLTKQAQLVLRQPDRRVLWVSEAGRTVLTGLDSVALDADAIPSARALVASDEKFLKEVREGLGEAMVPAMAGLFVEWVRAP